MSPIARFLVVASLCLLAAWPRAHAREGVVEMYFRAHVTIAPDGALSAIAWGNEHRIPEALREKLEARVRSWKFAPGAVNGVPAETESTLRLRLSARPVGDGEAYQIRVVNAETGPSMAMLPPPEFPRDALRFGAEAQVLAEIIMDADGTRHVSLAHYQGRDRFRKAFEAAVRTKLAKTEIFPEQVGGHRVAARFAIPISFCINDGCDAGIEVKVDSDDGSSLPTTAPGDPVPQGSVARLVTDVRGTAI